MEGMHKIEDGFQVIRQEFDRLASIIDQNSALKNQLKYFLRTELANYNDYNIVYKDDNVKSDGLVEAKESFAVLLMYISVNNQALLQELLAAHNLQAKNDDNLKQLYALVENLIACCDTKRLIRDINAHRKIIGEKENVIGKLIEQVDMLETKLADVRRNESLTSLVPQLQTKLSQREHAHMSDIAQMGQKIKIGNVSLKNLQRELSDFKQAMLGINTDLKQTLTDGGPSHPSSLLIEDEFDWDHLQFVWSRFVGHYQKTAKQKDALIAQLLFWYRTFKKLADPTEMSLGFAHVEGRLLQLECLCFTLCRSLSDKLAYASQRSIRLHQQLAAVSKRNRDLNEFRVQLQTTLDKTTSHLADAQRQLQENFSTIRALEGHVQQALHTGDTKVRQATSVMEHKAQLQAAEWNGQFERTQKGTPGKP